MTRLFWLSFVDADRPVGTQFLGVAIIEVMEVMAANMRDELRLMFPNHEPGAEWIAAAAREAHRLGCNPGGEVASVEIDDDHGVPRGRLLSRADLEAVGAI
jgi:hypothetical protein